jgi:hypothetical protein
MKLLFIKIVFVLFIGSQFSSITMAGEPDFADPYIKAKYSESELLEKIKDFPPEYRSQDKLSIYKHSSRAVVLMKSPDAISVWKLDGREIDTGQIEKLMSAECVSPKEKVFSWFYWRNYSLLRSHIGKEFPKDYPVIFDRIHRYDKNKLKSKVLKLLRAAKISKNEAVLICATIN